MQFWVWLQLSGISHVDVRCMFPTTVSATSISTAATAATLSVATAAVAASATHWKSTCHPRLWSNCLVPPINSDCKHPLLCT